ncbi:replication initiation factor domain-containing protein, partial [Blautia hansenii]|nr:replication initiation factor domain-containing protein [Blautia hansenii]NSJ87545.1 replication initiation factor domain-containing protein [Blautia hansenii]
ALGGLEKVGTMLDKARYSNSLSSKLTAHLQRINRTDLIPYIQYDTKHGKGGI